MGITVEPEALDLWPEHWLTWAVWMALSNAWNVVAGNVGLIYIGFDRAAAVAVMGPLGVKKSERERVLQDLLTLEEAALPILNARQ